MDDQTIIAWSLDYTRGKEAIRAALQAAGFVEQARAADGSYSWSDGFLISPRAGEPEVIIVSHWQDTPDPATQARMSAAYQATLTAAGYPVLAQEETFRGRTSIKLWVRPAEGPVI